MVISEKSARLNDFKTWVATHIKGDEKGEAQIYLDRLFKGFGHAGWAEVGATCEKRVKNDTGGTSFADLVWKPRVVIEMKRRGVDLSKHYSQAFTYWTCLVPQRPRYAVLCNFDEFWVYDFETQMDTPVEKIQLAELPEKFGALNFLFPGEVPPVFGNHHEEVTREAADKLATCFNSMIVRGVDRALAQRFTLQLLMAFFAEDIGLLEKYLVKSLLNECTSPSDTFDLLGGLFEAMNRKEGNPGGRYKGVAYFNGGLYAQPAKVELIDHERTLLKEACDFNWSKVRPEIFGTLFERSLGKEQRHATGAHFTTAGDIMKIVGPTIVEPWRKAINASKTLTEMQELVHRMQTFTVLDPACGSGNFLFIAYRELKRLEAELYTRMSDRFPKSVDPLQRTLGFVTTSNFYGLDVNPFAVEIAKVTMMLAHKLSIDELHVSESALPLDNLDANIVHRDALIAPDGSRSPWPQTDVIIGNPPFLGVKKMRPELESEYVDRVRKAYPDVPGMADFCVYWIKRANDLLPMCTVKDPLSGRAGLVGTQNIRSNQSRVGGLDHVVASGTIVEAVNNQPWSGEANVHVSIANWIKTKESGVVPSERRLWSARRLKPAHSSGFASKQYDLDMTVVPFISSSLSADVDVAAAVRLKVNDQVLTGQGITPGHAGFLLTSEQRAKLLNVEPSSEAVIRPYVIGDDILGKEGKATRWIIDLGNKTILEAQQFPRVLQHLQTTVLPTIELAVADAKSERATSIDRWWQHWRGRADLIQAISKLSKYLACSRITKRPLFAFVSATELPGDALQVFALDDDYSFGVLQSNAHHNWFEAKCSNMKSDPRYTSSSVFATFPWPQSPSVDEVNEVAKAARNLLNIRAAALAKLNGGLRELYATIDLPGKNPLKNAHVELDQAVLAAYGFAPQKNLLLQLLDLNLELTTEIDAGNKVTGPGIPASYPVPETLVSVL